MPPAEFDSQPGLLLSSSVGLDLRSSLYGDRFHSWPSAFNATIFTAHEPGLVGETVEEAIADIEASWNGDYGEFWVEASVVAELDDKIVGALLTVKQAPWDQTPDGPFIIELFVDSDMRGRGVARRLMERGLDSMASQNARAVGLRVLADSTRAHSFYRSVGFTDWTPA